VEDRSKTNTSYIYIYGEREREREKNIFLKLGLLEEIKGGGKDEKNDKE
jgi:hypothetical protein